MKQSQTKSQTSSRKKDHVLLTVKRDVAFRAKSTGFENWEFVHNALPEINFADVSTETVFLSKRIEFPFMISCMTGGYADAKRINRGLAEVCEEHSVAMGVGSQRQALEDTTYHSSFSVARKAAPTIPIVGNIGAAEVAKLTDASPVQRLADLVRADAFAVHLNPLQELLQPEGSPAFRGVLRGIESLVRGLSIPVIVKEIGAGISKDVAQRLISAGVAVIDVAGAGGTSWAGVEILRKKDGHADDLFWDWGISTSEALRQVASLRSSTPGLTLIASRYARASGRVGVALVTSGPGATNTVTPVRDSQADSVPIVVICGQVATTAIGTDAFQEAPVPSIMGAVAKHVFLVTDPTKLEATVRTAFEIARTGRPGPVVLDIPKDVQNWKGVFHGSGRLPIPGYRQRMNRLEAAKLPEAACASFFAALAKSERPLIYAGGGVINAGASQALREFSREFHIPVVTTLMGIGAVDSGRRSVPNRSADLQRMALCAR